LIAGRKLTLDSAWFRTRKRCTRLNDAVIASSIRIQLDTRPPIAVSSVMSPGTVRSV